MKPNGYEKGDGRMLKFKGYCVENGIKQSEVAEILGLKKCSINRKMNGHEPFTLEQVKTLCRHYGISADIYFV